MRYGSNVLKSCGAALGDRLARYLYLACCRWLWTRASLSCTLVHVSRRVDKGAPKLTFATTRWKYLLDAARPVATTTFCSDTLRKNPTRAFSRRNNVADQRCLLRRGNFGLDSHRNLSGLRSGGSPKGTMNSASNKFASAWSRRRCTATN